MTATCAHCGKVHFFPGTITGGSERPCRKCGAAFLFLEVDALPNPDWGTRISEWGGGTQTSPLTRLELDRNPPSEPPAVPPPTAQPSRPPAEVTWKFNRLWWYALSYSAALVFGFASIGYGLVTRDFRLLAGPLIALVVSHFEWLKFEITPDQIIITDLLRVRRWPRKLLRDVGKYESFWRRGALSRPLRYVEIEFEGGHTIKLHTGSQQEDVAGAVLTARNEDRTPHHPSLP